MRRSRILVVDDKENMVKLFEKLLGDSYDLSTASDGQKALALIAVESFDVVITDLRMPEADGFEVLRSVKEHSAETEVILMTAYASIQSAVDAIRQGAYDYIQKPFEPDDVLLVVTRALERRALKAETITLRRQLEELVGPKELIGTSASMRHVYMQIEQAASLDITVLATGESGTGKELVARAIHARGPKENQPFIAVNCGALPNELVESELFGHAKGAFSGATAAKRGLFEEAHGGTIFLDEIGDLPLPAQVKLTRVLQEKEVRRIGENRAQKIDVRVIAATHRDLKEEVQSGRFREDLFYRLNVFQIRLPALRERREDIPLLVTHFIDKHAKRHKRQISGITPEALKGLVGYSWPGNVRELGNVLERAVAISPGPLITVQGLPEEVIQRQEGSIPINLLLRLTYREAIETARDRTSHEYLMALMETYQGNVTRAAEHADMERESLHRLLKKHVIHPEAYRT